MLSSAGLVSSVLPKVICFTSWWVLKTSIRGNRKKQQLTVTFIFVVLSVEELEDPSKKGKYTIMKQMHTLRAFEVFCFCFCFFVFQFHIMLNLGADYCKTLTSTNMLGSFVNYSYFTFSGFALSLWLQIHVSLSEKSFIVNLLQDPLSKEKEFISLGVKCIPFLRPLLLFPSPWFSFFLSFTCYLRTNQLLFCLLQFLNLNLLQNVGRIWPENAS